MEIGKREIPNTNCKLDFATVHAIAMVEWIAVESLEVEMNAECVAHWHSILDATDVSRASSVEDRIRVHRHRINVRYGSRSGSQTLLFPEPLWKNIHLGESFFSIFFSGSW